MQVTMNFSFEYSQSGKCHASTTHTHCGSLFWTPSSPSSFSKFSETCEKKKSCSGLFVCMDYTYYPLKFDEPCVTSWRVSWNEMWCKNNDSEEGYCALQAPVSSHHMGGIAQRRTQQLLQQYSEPNCMGLRHESGLCRLRSILASY